MSASTPPILPPPDPRTPAVKKRWKFLSGAFAGSLIIHAIILINVGAVVLISGSLSPTTFVMNAVESPVIEEIKAEEVPEAPAPTPTDTIAEEVTSSSGGGSGPTMADVGMNTAELLTTTASNPDFTMPQGMSAVAAPIGTSAKLFSSGSSGTSGSGSGSVGAGSLFGNNTRTMASLTGYLYDLKQSQKGESPPPGTNFRKILTEVSGSWNLKVLKDYYKSRKPLYLSQLFIPAIKADEAPKAFGVERDVQPRQWMACYSGTIKAPQSGNYRFVGFGDDFLIVRLKGEVAFDGSLHNIYPNKVVAEDLGRAYSMPDRGIGQNLLASPWFPMEKDVEIPMEIVIAEDPGGYFSSLLMIQKQGGAPVVFRLDRTKLPDYKPGYDGPQVNQEEVLFGVPPT